VNNLKKFIEAIKDFLYDAVDYLLMFAIVLVVAGVIGWRLDILFAKDMDKTPISQEETEIKDTYEEATEDIKDNTENTDDEVASDDESTTSSEENKPSEDSEKPTDQPSNEIITVKIPDGSLAHSIANILYDKGLISSKSDFLKTSQELKLDTKLKPGEFKISQGSSLETVIKTIAK